MSRKLENTWRSYEEVAAYLLNEFASEFNLEFVEPKQKVKGKRSETEWTIDAKGVKEDNQGFVIIECRRYLTSRQNQEKLAGLAYRIIDTGASGGIIVSSLGLQKGAKKIASSESVLAVELNSDCTPQNFTMSFLNKLMVGIELTAAASMTTEATVYRSCANCGKKFIVEGNEKICQICAQNI